MQRMNKVKINQKFNQNQLYIDKTEELQKGIEGFPFVYIEGFAACGKSVAVKLLLEKHPAVESYVVNMSSNNAPERLKVTLNILRNWIKENAPQCRNSTRGIGIILRTRKRGSL